jgi:hypothetical protein
MKIDSIINRRTFIKSAAIFSGLTAMLGIVKPTASRPKDPLPQPVQDSQGYRLTDHIRKYYDTARL